jgi:hypothetical protein
MNVIKAAALPQMSTPLRVIIAAICRQRGSYPGFL